MPTSLQLAWLFILAIPIACITWTVTHEEIFRELHEYCLRKSRDCRSLLTRKFFYLFTCEYCFSHYITVIFLCITGFKLLLMDWRGYLLAGFSLVWIANIYMSFYGMVRVGLKKEKTVISKLEEEMEKGAGRPN
jgi:hypothetical protein